MAVHEVVTSRSNACVGGAWQRDENASGRAGNKSLHAVVPWNSSSAIDQSGASSSNPYWHFFKIRQFIWDFFTSCFTVLEISQEQRK